MWTLIEQYQKNICSKLVGRKRPSKTLFDYIYSVYGDFDADTDDEETQFSPMDVEGSQSKEMTALADWANKPSPDYAAETPWLTIDSVICFYLKFKWSLGCTCILKLKKQISVFLGGVFEACEKH